jgi:hypothetical protein
MSSELRSRFIDELIAKGPEKITSLWLLERIPYVFDGDLESYIDWKHTLSRKIGIDSNSLLLVGSGCVGVSLSLHKNYKAFDKHSDIDVAVVSDYHFNEAWRTLRNLGTRIHGLRPKERQSVENHVRKYIYWGTIATDHILPLFPFAQQWEDALMSMSGVKPTEDREIKARIYKDFESLRNYHLINLRSLRNNALSPK